MQMNSKVQSKAIQIVNSEPILTLKVDKRRLGELVSKTLIVLIAVLLSIAVATMFLTNHAMFQPLFKAYVLIALTIAPATYFKSFKN